MRRSALAQVKQRQQAGGGQRLGAVVQGVVSTQGSIFVASLQARIRKWDMKMLEVSGSHAGMVLLSFLFVNDSRASAEELNWILLLIMGSLV